MTTPQGTLPCDQHGKVKTPEKVAGEVTSIDRARGTVTVRQAPRGPQVLVRVCLICSQPMEPYQPAVYLDSGAVVHLPCRRAFRGAATTSMAVIRPTSQAMRLRAGRREIVEELERARRDNLGGAKGPSV